MLDYIKVKIIFTVFTHIRTHAQWQVVRIILYLYRYVCMCIYNEIIKVRKCNNIVVSIYFAI